MQMGARFKKLKTIFSNGSDLHMNEVWALGRIEHAIRTTGSGIGNSLIQEELHITKSAISQIIDSLVLKGYVNRMPNAHDRRRMQLTITPEGKQILERMSRQANDLADKVAENMGEEKIRLMFDLLNEFLDGFDEAQRALEAGRAEDEPRL
jgi:DNA-binding MarR family transcriptional regulator